MYSGSYIKFALIYIKNSNISWYILGEKKQWATAFPRFLKPKAK